MSAHTTARCRTGTTARLGAVDEKNCRAGRCCASVLREPMFSSSASDSNDARDAGERRGGRGTAKATEEEREREGRDAETGYRMGRMSDGNVRKATSAVPQSVGGIQMRVCMPVCVYTLTLRTRMITWRHTGVQLKACWIWAVHPPSSPAQRAKQEQEHSCTPFEGQRQEKVRENCVRVREEEKATLPPSTIGNASRTKTKQG